MSDRLIIFGRLREEERMSIGEPVRSREGWKKKVLKNCDMTSLLATTSPCTAGETNSMGCSNRRHVYFHSPEKLSFMPHIYLLCHFFVLAVIQTQIKHNSHLCKYPPSTGEGEGHRI